MSEDRERKAREVGPRYPFIGLQRALERAEVLRNVAGEYPIGFAEAKTAWSYGAKSSGGDQTIGALRAYGLIESAGSGRIKLTGLALRYLRDERPEERAKLRSQFAFIPSVMNTLWGMWGANPPPDPAARSILKLDLHFPDRAADELLRLYRENLRFSGRAASDTIPTSAETKVEEQEADLDLPNVKVGDYVRWTGQPFDQGDTPRQVVGLFPDGEHVQVFGSDTGIPMSELIIVDPPAPTLTSAKSQQGDTASVVAQRENEYSVLQRGNRLQITADVDLEGLETLKKMIAGYETILTLLEGKKPN